MYVTTHRLARFSIVALVIVAIPTLIALARPAQLAWACSCVGLDDQRAFDLADVAFRGKLIGYASPLTKMATEPVTTTDRTVSSMDPATWTFAVLEVYKGDLAAVVDILSPWSGASCGLELPDEGEFYVFANGDPGSSERAPDLHASLCGGTRSVVDRPLAVEGVTPKTAATGTPYIHADTMTTAASDDGSVEPEGPDTGTTPLATLGLVALAAIALAVAIAMRRRV